MPVPHLEYMFHEDRDPIFFTAATPAPLHMSGIQYDIIVIERMDISTIFHYLKGRSTLYYLDGSVLRMPG